MTIHLEEFQVSKLTTVSLCDTVDSLQNTSSKANRDFDTTESLLHTRNNSYAKKVYKACNLKDNSVGTVSLTKCIQDYSKVLAEIKDKVGDELTNTYNKLDAQFEKVFKKHTEYFNNPLIIQYQTLSYNIAALTHEYHSDVDSLIPEFQSELSSITPQITEYNNTFIQTELSIKTKLDIEYKKYTNLHNKHIKLELLRRKKITEIIEKYIEDKTELELKISEADISNKSSLYQQLEDLTKVHKEEIKRTNETHLTLNKEEQVKEKEVLDKYKSKIIEEQLNSRDITYIGLYLLNHLKLMSFSGVSGLTDITSFVNKYKNWFKQENDKKIAADEAYNNKYDYLNIEGLWQNYFDTPEGNGEEAVIRMRLVEQALLALVPYDIARLKYSYLNSFSSWINNPNFISIQPPNINHEPVLDIVSYQDPDVNFFNTKLLLEIFGHPSLNIESIGYNNPKQLLSIDSVGVDKNNPNIIKSNFTLKSGNEELEHIIPSNKVFHIGYKFELNNVTVYGYVTSDTLSTTLKLDTKELDFKSIPYIPIKLQNTSLAKDKRLEEDSLYFEEFLRNLYIPYYKLDSKITNLGLAKYTVNTDSASLNYPLNDVISNVGISISAPVNSESTSVCKYLTYLFSKVIDSKDKEGFDKWSIGKKGTNVNDTDEFPYLYENQLSFKSDMGETIIGYSYIEQEEKTGKLSKASSKIISGTNTKINYGSVQRLLKYGINILSNGFGFSGISTHIHGNNIYYDDSKLEIKVQTNEDKYTVTTVYGFTHTFIVNGSYPLKDIESNWLVYEYESNYTNINPPKYLRTTKDTTRTTFGLKTNETTTKVLSSYIDFKKKITVYENNQIKFNYVGKHVDIEPSENINVSIPLIYFDIQDKNSDYYKLKMINTIESLFFDSIQLQIICTIPDKQLSEMARELRNKLLFSYMYFFIDPEINTTTIDASNAKFNRAEANRNRVRNSISSGSFSPNYKQSDTSYKIESDYKDFRIDNYVGIGLTYYNAIPRRNPDNTLDPVFLELQYKREWEVKNMLTKGTTSNLYKDEHSHINSTLTGLYKYIDFIEPFFDIRDNYKKPMFNT